MTVFLLYMIGMMYFIINDESPKEELEKVSYLEVALTCLLWPLSVLVWVLFVGLKR